MIKLKDLTVTRSAEVLVKVSRLEVAAGERLCIEGANGSGKSTLMRVLAGLETEYIGSVAIAAPLRERTLVHQNPFLFRGTVLSNVLFGLKTLGLGRRETRRRAAEWIERTGLEDFAHRRCRGLSGGERRRVALARAFALDPSLLLLDEPLSDLDREGADLLERALPRFPQATILMTSPKGEATALAQRTIKLESL